MSNNIQSIQRHFNRAAQSYDAVAQLQRHYVEQMLSDLTEKVNHTAHIADIGCGTGVLAKLVSTQSLGWQITGVDIAAEMCEVASPHQTTTIHADMHALPLEDHSADASVCAFALQWSDDPALAISELARITKPGGYVCILTFLDGTLSELATACEKAGAAKKTNHFFAATHYKRWFSGAGLTVVNEALEVQKTLYPNPRKLFSTLKQMGATNSDAGSIKGLGNRGELAAICDAYEDMFAADGMVPASWHVGYWLLRA